VDHALTDQSSVLRFIEDNWRLPRLGNGSADASADSIESMFYFGQPGTQRLFLNPVTGEPTAR
jgi:phospholipase C